MRQEILQTVEQNPGTHFREIQRETGCSSTTLNHHLKSLDLRERKIHGYRRFYPENVSRDLEIPLAALNHEVRGLMLYKMQEGIEQKELVEELGKSKSTVSTHLKVLKEDGLVQEETEGRSKVLYPSRKSLKALNSYAKDLLDDSSEAFIDMWE